MSDKIHFIFTGGTIDGFYDAVGQTAKPGETSVIPEYIQSSIKPYLDLSFEQICMKDSKDITDQDRNAVLDAARKTEAGKILITHGTDTMTITADFLKDKLGAAIDKTIILVGSMIPLKGFTNSDSGFNLGFAISQIQTLKPGVYICMNARVFEAGHVIKNLKEARFEDK